MYKGLYISSVGSLMQERRMDMIANNISNINNSGYKRDFPIFEAVEPAGVNNMDTAYVKASAQITDYSQGGLIETSDPLDIAIEGEGFYRVQSSDGVLYTRKGDFTLNKEGVVVTHEGDTVLGSNGAITIPKGAEISIDGKGNISVHVKGKNISLGNLGVVNMTKPYPLEKVGNGMYRATDEVSVVPVNFATTRLRQGFVEGSNVSAVTELVEMINSNRAYESYQKVLRAMDDVNQKSVTELARLA